MSTLFAPIAINGGDVVPTTLVPRELFLDTQNKYLYACFSRIDNDVEVKTSIESVRVKSADSALSIAKNWLNIDTQTMKFEVGNLSYDGTKFTPKSTASTYEFNQPTVTNLKKLVLDKNSQIYGATLPATGVEGQVFFKLG